MNTIFRTLFRAFRVFAFACLLAMLAAHPVWAVGGGTPDPGAVPVLEDCGEFIGSYLAFADQEKGADKVANHVPEKAVRRDADDDELPSGTGPARRQLQMSGVSRRKYTAPELKNFERVRLMTIS